MEWPAILSVNTTAITILGYPLSWIELVGTLLYLWSVWLIARRRMLTWPIGIFSVLLYLVLFLQIRLYSDALEQVYYLGVSAYGWMAWRQSRTSGAALSARVVTARFSGRRALVAVAVVTLVAGLLLGIFMARIHLTLPAVFPEPASFPMLDAVTTVMSFAAMWLLARRRSEAWVYWILVDVAAIWIYWVKDVRFLSLLYVCLLFIAMRGLRDWMTESPREERAARLQEV